MFRKKFIDRLREKYKSGGARSGVRKYHEGGPQDPPTMSLDDLNAGYDQAHYSQPHHAGGNTGGDTGSMYGPNSDNPTGPPPEYGAYYGLNPNWNQSLKGFYDTAKKGAGFGIYGTGFDKLKQQGLDFAEDTWNNIKPTGKAIKNIGSFFGGLFEDGGVRHQEGGMYDQMRQYQGGGKKYNLTGDYNTAAVSGTEMVDESGNILPMSPAYLQDPKYGSSIDLQGNPILNKSGMPTWYGPSKINTGMLAGNPYSSMNDPSFNNTTPFNRESQSKFGLAYPKKKETGGTRLPGGTMQQIPGSDAVEFIGQSHDQGGIMVDPQTEVEGGETMDQVNMAKKGGKRDYFFSSHLKEGGRSYADMHKEILENGGSQEEINMLARMQEKAAGRNPKKVAKLGGVMQYQGGGYTTDTSNQVNDNMLAHRYKILEDIDDGKPIYNEIDNNEFIDPNDLNDKGDAESFLNNFFKIKEEQRIIEKEKEEEKNVVVNKKNVVVNKTTPKKREEESLIKLPMREVTPEQWEKAFPGLYDAPNDPWEDGEPTGTGLSDAEIEEMIRTNGSDKEKSFLAKLKERFLQGDVPLAAYTAGIAQLAPAAYAILHKQDDAEQSVYTPGFTSPIIAERGKASHLERVNYNAERSRNAADMRGINKFIETSGGGPANIINKMSAYARKQEGDMKITAAETRANADIANREAQMNQQMAINNMQRAQQASMTNAQLSRAETARMDQIDQLNAQARQKLKDDQEAMKYQGIGLAAQGIAGLAGDVMSYQAQERLAESIGTDGVYQRDRLRNLFRKANPDATEEEINMLVANYTKNTTNG